eukprot:177787-Chlamydomonas_euryale.AAC.4
MPAHTQQCGTCGMCAAVRAGGRNGQAARGALLLPVSVQAGPEAAQGAPPPSVGPGRPRGCPRRPPSQCRSRPAQRLPMCP